MKRLWLVLVAAAAAAGCSTPYDPPILVHGGSKFPGIVEFVEPSPGPSVDVVLVHGMCTHRDEWADATIGNLARAMGASVSASKTERMPERSSFEDIHVVHKTVAVAGGTINFSAVMWSPLTTPLKHQLDYDKTGVPTDCSLPGECKPRRARLNGSLKDILLDDCLSDAIAYQGRSRIYMRARVVEALSGIVERSASTARAAGVAPGPLVIVSESLGSKLAFDALEEMTSGAGATSRTKQAGNEVLDRLALVFMGANQMPILGLADQDAGDNNSSTAEEISVQGSVGDSLQRLLKIKSERGRSRAGASVATPAAPAMTLVAYTDPNDLLSYRLQPSRYNIPGIAVADVLVSNSSTYLGLIERPDRAHTGYIFNKSVTDLIACGSTKHVRCK